MRKLAIGVAEIMEQVVLLKTLPDTITDEQLKKAQELYENMQSQVKGCIEVYQHYTDNYPVTAKFQNEPDVRLGRELYHAMNFFNEMKS